MKRMDPGLRVKSAALFLVALVVAGCITPPRHVSAPAVAHPQAHPAPTPERTNVSQPNTQRPSAQSAAPSAIHAPEPSAPTPEDTNVSQPDTQRSAVAPGFERWRSAVENYVPSVRLGTQTDLDGLHSTVGPCAEYLGRIHDRIHPVFADTFLASLDKLPNDDPMASLELRTFLELVLSQTDGHIVRMGVIRISGVTAFDIGALESVERASPFGAPPPEIVSPDGNVYLHWEFHRRPEYACSTYFARAYRLQGRPGNAPSDTSRPARFR
jgi:hypothetical protein